MSTNSLLSSLALEWRAGDIPDTEEAPIPDGTDPFAVAKELRDRDPTAAYACVERGAGWLVVSMPDDPPDEPPAAQISEPCYRLWKMRVTVWALASPMFRAEFIAYGTSERFLQSAGRKLANIAPRCLGCTHDRIQWTGPTSAEQKAILTGPQNEIAMCEAVAGIVNHVRRVYPRDVPTNDELARVLAHVFEGDE